MSAGTALSASTGAEARRLERQYERDARRPIEARREADTVAGARYLLPALARRNERADAASDKKTENRAAGLVGGADVVAVLRRARIADDRANRRAEQTADEGAGPARTPAATDLELMNSIAGDGEGLASAAYLDRQSRRIERANRADDGRRRNVRSGYSHARAGRERCVSRIVRGGSQA